MTRRQRAVWRCSVSPYRTNDFGFCDSGNGNRTAKTVNGTADVFTNSTKLMIILSLIHADSLQILLLVSQFLAVDVAFV